MRRVRGKLGGPRALFFHHSGQRHSDRSHARSSVRLAFSQLLSCPPNKTGVRAFQPFGDGIQGTIQSGGLLIHLDLFAGTDFHLFC